MGGGKGGGSQKTVTEPWKAAQPYVKESFDVARGVLENPAEYFPGQTFVGPTAGETGAWDQMLKYSDDVFGGQPTMKYGDATSALTKLLQGPDYNGVQGAIEAANAPILRQFNEQIIPGLNQKATFLNNETGGIKALNRVMPEIGGRMAENAQGLMNQERLQGREMSLRALGLTPTIAEMGQFPGQLGMDFANWGRGFQEQALGDQMSRWDFQQNQPQDLAGWYANLVGGLGGLGQTTKGTGPKPNTGLNLLGGATAGASLAPLLGMGGGMGAGMGALLAFL